MAGLVSLERAVVLAHTGARAIGVRDEWSREREQTDCEHRERAVHASDLVHRVPPFR
jgi:hypothetical protein